MSRKEVERRVEEALNQERAFCREYAELGYLNWRVRERYNLLMRLRSRLLEQIEPQ